MVFIGESSQNGRNFQVSELLLAQVFEAHGNLEIPHLKAPFHTDEKVSFTNYSSLVHFARQSTAALPINQKPAISWQVVASLHLQTRVRNDCSEQVCLCAI